MQVALFSVVWGITMMHRCCGVYDLGFLRVAVAAANLLFIFCACQWRCAPVLLPSLCGDGGATRVWDRGERYAWRNPPCAPRCCCLLSPTLCWVDGTQLPSLWWSSCMWCASNTVPSHCVDDSLVVALIRDCACCISFFHSPFLFGGHCLDLTQSNQEDEEKRCLEGRRVYKAAMWRVERLLCRKEIVRGERGRTSILRPINPMRLAEEWRKGSNRTGPLTVEWRMYCWRERNASPAWG
ncbi:retrotransposon hot spot (RHS) protein [Trypanosoma cruzi]|nr:retrotransposon hot spot (RHS) protein [Trypanosoma cruzi]